MPRLSVLSVFLCFALAFSAVQAAGHRAGLAPELERILTTAAPDEFVPVIVRTSTQADLSRLAPDAGYEVKLAHLQAVAEEAQRELVAWLAASDARNVRSFWLESEVALSARPALIRALAGREDVAFITDDFVVTLDVSPISSAHAERLAMQEWGVSRVKAPECWAAGYNGAGIVVGNLDTGVEVSHSAFGGRWRSADGWFDAVNGQGSPYDDNGHGTHTMGTAVGAGGIGVAPGATFVVAKGFDNTGSAYTSWLDACLDWIAGTARPQVFSNSWSSTRTSNYFFNRFNNLRGLGIISVASIGNSGPGGSTSCPPGSFPVAIGVGATTSSDAVATFSSRGPAPNSSPWSDTQYWPRTDWNLVNPAIAAPGQGIRSALPGGGYGNMDGTSMSCPHAAGAAAILLQKKSDLTPQQVFNLLADHADRPSGGAPYPNANYGWGILNCKTALDNVGGGGGEEETLKVYHTYDDAIGLTSGGVFYTAARLTPTSGNCDVVAGFFLHHEPTQNQHFFIWRGNTNTNPGALVESLPYPGADSGWKRVNLSSPFRVNVGEDVWLGPRYQHAAGQFPGAVDGGPLAAQRGDWLNFAGVWQELSEFGFACNWMMGAIVRYAGGIEEEVLFPASGSARLVSAAPARDRARISYFVPAAGPVELTAHDAAGRLMKVLHRGRAEAGERETSWDLTDDRGRRVPAGVYCLRLSLGGRILTAKSVVLE